MTTSDKDLPLHINSAASGAGTRITIDLRSGIRAGNLVDDNLITRLGGLSAKIGNAQYDGAASKMKRQFKTRGRFRMLFLNKMVLV